MIWLKAMKYKRSEDYKRTFNCKELFTGSNLVMLSLEESTTQMMLLSFYMLLNNKL